MACDLVRSEVLYNILTEFGVPVKLVRIIKTCLSDTCKKPLGRPKHRSKENIKIELKTGCDNVGWNHLAQDWDHGNDAFKFHKRCGI
jgi:hypothetical protein